MILAFISLIDFCDRGRGGQRWQTDHAPVSLCLPKCRPARTAGFIYPSDRWGWTTPQHTHYLEHCEANMTRWVSDSVYVCKIILETAAITPNFAQWALCICPIFPPPCLAECEHDGVIRQLHLPRLPPAIPWQPARGVEHHGPAWPQGQTLLQPLQRGTLPPVWIWLHPGNMLDKLPFICTGVCKLAH